MAEHAKLLLSRYDINRDDVIDAKEVSVVYGAMLVESPVANYVPWDECVSYFSTAAAEATVSSMTKTIQQRAVTQAEFAAQRGHIADGFWHLADGCRTGPLCSSFCYLRLFD